MVSFSVLFIFPCIFHVISGNFTRLLPRNALLSRRKRYLTFPMGSNFVITGSFLKAIQQVQPTGWNIVGEMDVPFPLPSDTSLFKGGKIRRHHIERRQVYTQFAGALSEAGFNGEACVKRMICEVQKYPPFKGQSLVNDILYAVFTPPGGTFEAELEAFQNACDQDNFLQCETSIFGYVLSAVLQ